MSILDEFAHTAKTLQKTTVLPAGMAVSLASAADKILKS